MNMGELVPIGWKEILPGDHFRQSTTVLVRTQPLLAPLMHQVQAKIFHFFVPNRLLWDNWEPFITGGEDGENASVHPYITMSTPPLTGSLLDYMGGTGLVPSIANNYLSALPFRAYAKICNDYFVDQDLVTPLVLNKTDGNDMTTNMAVFAPAWKKDYFTLARPQPSKGPDVTAPVSADVESTNTAIGINFGAGDRMMVAQTDRLDYSGADAAGTPTVKFGANPGLEVVGSVNALDLREMFATLRFQELRSRFGSKYVDYLAYLGVKSDDARLQRAEYLGGGVQPLQFSEVLQTSPDDAENPVGALKGHGIAAKRSNRYRKYFQEHGILMTLMYVMPEPVYAQGIDRSYLRKTKEDYWQPEYEHIGQQVVQNQEIDSSATDPEGTFGWIDRYEEYRRSLSTVSGEFRPGQPLDYWTMARGFSSPPVLNGDFVTGNPTNRVWPAPNEQQLYVMVGHDIKARRKVTANPKGYVY
nr:MAG: major capsid protein [Microvirus sp.]